MKARTTKNFPAMPMTLNFVLETPPVRGVHEELEENGTVD